MPTTPSLEITAMSRLIPWFEPLSMINDARLFAATGADHLRGRRLRDELFFESEQGLQAVRLLSILTQPDLLQLQFLNLLLQIAVFLPHPAQIQIIVPHTADTALQPDNRLFQRSDRRDRPDADQARRLILRLPLDLYRSPTICRKMAAARMLTLR